MCHIFYSFYMGLGIPGSGSAGAILTISLFASQKIVPGIMGCISTILWFLTGAWFLVLYKKIHTVYRLGGHSVADARNEAVRKAAGTGLVGAYLKSGTGGVF
ncbi:hypothetical protein HK097_001346 [Rhizophlyctis rosea]|uniref:Uncharacterized protein n=1 Tax=Rhizophlyctis rosea TaxID=64517 RepID=A0AAD5S5R9_9FUNG|nr:hypothetical protein HK097_001346 [Rhizophlyctis rosea]